MDWFRFYSETMRDTKIRRVARKTSQSPAQVIGIWSVLLSMASESSERGRLTIGDGVPVTADDIEDVTGCNVSETLQEMTRIGMLEIDGDCYVIPAWNKRQFQSDSSTGRVQKSRENKRQQTGEQAKASQSETLQQRFGNVSVTPSDTDTDSDTDSETSSGVAPQLSNVWDLYCQRFSEVFRHMPPGTMTPDDGTFAALVARGLTLAQVDAGITTSLETFKPSKANPYPKSWRYCLPAMERTLEPRPARSNGRAPQDRDLDTILGITPNGKPTDDPAIVEASFSVIPERGRQTQH